MLIRYAASMWRRIQHLLVGVSLVVWLATAAIWLRGKVVDWDGVGVGYRSERGELEEVNSHQQYRVKRAGPGGHTTDGVYLASEQGSFGFLLLHQHLEAGAGMFTEEQPGWRSLSAMPLTMRPSMTWMGFGSEVDSEYKGWSYKLVVPQWFFLLLATPLPVWWLWRHRQHRKRLREGHCLSCGYDCRATPEKCPECGAAVRPSAEPNAAMDRPRVGRFGRLKVSRRGAGH
jgi:hypothetical protein